MALNTSANTPRKLKIAGLDDDDFMDDMMFKPGAQSDALNNTVDNVMNQSTIFRASDLSDYSGDNTPQDMRHSVLMPVSKAPAPEEKKSSADKAQIKPKF